MIMRHSPSSRRPPPVKRVRSARPRLLLELLEDRTLLSGESYLPPSNLLMNPTGLLTAPAHAPISPGQILMAAPARALPVAPARGLPPAHAPVSPARILLA